MKAVRKLPVIMMVLLFGMIAFVTNLAAPLGIVVKEQFNVDSVWGLLGNLANFIAYAVMGVPAGRLLHRVGYKSTAIIAVAVGFIGVVVQFISGLTGSFYVYLAGAFIAGFSMCILNTVINPMMEILGGGGKRSNQLIQIGAAFSSVTATLVLVMVGLLVGDVTSETELGNVNSLLYIAMIAFAAIAIALIFVAIPEPGKRQVSVPYSRNFPWSYPHFVLGTIAVFVGVGIEVGVPGTLNFFLVDSGVPASVAGLVVGSYFIFMLIGRVAGVYLAGKMRSNVMLACASVVGIIFLIVAMSVPESVIIGMPALEIDNSGLSIGLYSVPLSSVFFVATGLCTSVLWGVIFNLSVNGLGNEISNASGIFMMMVCGGGIIPLIQNKIALYVGYVDSYLVLVVGFIYLLYYAIYGCRLTGKNL